MHLQKLEVQGFKSFAQKTTLPFPIGDSHSKGIAAIVGPNGSGKSNIADAIRWVLGEQSMKLLRSKKSEDVIFSGSEKKAQLGFCEVSLYFNNEDNTFPLDIPEVIISRRLYRNGESEYCINKNKVKLSDISLLLAQAHFGQKSYNVIGQGMIDTIINTPPSERREFFNEAAGVKQYQIKKESALSRLKITKEHITQAHILLSELEPKIRFFQRQLKRLEERDEVEQQLIETLKRYYESLWNSLSQKRKEYEDRIENIQKNITIETHRHETTKTHFEELEKQSEHISPASFQSHQEQEYDVLSQEKSTLLSRFSLIEGRLSHEYEQSGEQHIQWLTTKERELSNRLISLQKEATTLSHHIQSLEKEEAHITAQLTTCTKEFHDAEKEIVNTSITYQPVNVEFIYDELKKISFQKKEESSTLEDITLYIRAVSEKIHVLIKKIEDSFSRDTNVIHAVRDTINTLSEKKRVLSSHQQSITMQLGIQRGSLSHIQNEVKKTERDLGTTQKDTVFFSTNTTNEKRTALLLEKGEIENKLQTLEATLTSLKEATSIQYTQERETHKALLDLQKEMAHQQSIIENTRQHITTFQLELVKIRTQQEELLFKIFEDLKITEELQRSIKEDTSTLSRIGFQETPPIIDIDHTRSTIAKLRQKLEHIGTIDTDILHEYETTKERYEFLISQMDDLGKATDSLLKAIDELDGIIKKQFDTALKNINIKFDQYFRQLFSGGSARLLTQVSEKDEDTHEESAEKREEIAGIEIHATPPGKKLKSVSVLSGGEKALTAIALICAIVSNTTPPFIVLDEVDAALDESNAMRFATIIQELREKTQFIIITHNRVTMHIASVVYGVTMGDDGVSRVLSLDIGKSDGILEKR